MSDDTRGSGTYRIDCPACDWQSREFGEITTELAAKVDAADHYVDVHGGQIPEEASFGEEQCPKCFDILGLDGTASCSECGFIPEENRLVPDGGKPADEVERDGTHVALHSGGLDSTIATHVAVRWGPADIVVHLDTGTGIDANEEFVRDFAREIGAQPWTLGTHEDYESIVGEHGFPGPSRHAIMYRRLKERQLQKLAALVDGELHCWTGVRSLESDRRMRTVEPDSEHDGGRWYWHAPIHDWSKQDCEEYLERFDLPRNPLWDTLGRSGDCWCGCFGNPEELIDAEAAGHLDHAEWIRNLEQQVETGDETGRWAWGALSDSERRAERVDDDQVTLCSDCGVAYPDGGRSR